MKKKWVFALLFAAALVMLLALPRQDVFTVELKSGERIRVEDFKYGVADEEERNDAIKLYHAFGDTYFPRSLDGVERLDLLDESGTSFRVTYDSGEVIEGDRTKTIKLSEDNWLFLPYAGVSDHVEGRYGRYNLRIPFRLIASISRGWKEDRNEQQSR